MDPGRRQSNRGVVWFALFGLLLFPLLTGCFSSDRVDPPLDQFNVEFLHLLTLGGDDFEDAIGPESLALVDDTTLAIGTEHDGVYFADLSDRAKPVVVSVFEYEGDGIADILAMDGFVYGFTPSSELLAIDARQPVTPTLAASIRGQERDHRTWRKGDLLLAANEGFLYTSMHGGIHIWNVADPYLLSLEGIYYLPQLRARGPFMYKTPGASPTTRQLESEKARGTFIAHENFSFENLPCGQRHIGNAEILGAATLGDMLIVRVGNVYCVGPEQKIVGYERDRTPIYGPVRKEVEYGGLWVLDVSNPAEPLAVSFLPLQLRRFHLPDVTVAANLVYLSSLRMVREGSAIVDVSEPGKPVLLDRQLNAELVVWEDSLLIVSIFHIHDHGLLNPSGYSNGLQVFDVSDAANPILIGMISESPGTDKSFVSIADIAFLDGYIYVAEDRVFAGGIHVLRLIDPNWRPDIAPTGAPEN